MAHARRKYVEALGHDTIRNEEKRSSSPAMIGIPYFDKLFEIERNIADLPPDERKPKLMESSLPILNELHE